MIVSRLILAARKVECAYTRVILLWPGHILVSWTTNDEAQRNGWEFNLFPFWDSISRTVHFSHSPRIVSWSGYYYDMCVWMCSSSLVTGMPSDFRRLYCVPRISLLSANAAQTIFWLQSSSVVVVWQPSISPLNFSRHPDRQAGRQAEKKRVAFYAKPQNRGDVRIWILNVTQKQSVWLNKVVGALRPSRRVGRS